MEDLKSLTPEQLTERSIKDHTYYLTVIHNLDRTMLAMKDTFNTPPELMIDARTLTGMLYDLKKVLEDTSFNIQHIAKTVSIAHNDVIAFMHKPKTKEATLHTDNDATAVEVALSELQRLNESLHKLGEFLLSYV